MLNPNSKRKSTNNPSNAKKQKTNDQSNDSESGLGSGLCDLLEENIKKNISQSFSQLRMDIEAKDNQIAQLEKKLQDVTKEKESLMRSFAVEREALEKQMSDLREKSKKKTCVCCEADLDQPNFCNSDCFSFFFQGVL